MLILGNNLLPILNYKIPFVKIRNPLGVGVVVWENVTTELGLAQLEYQLPQDSIEVFLTVLIVVFLFKLLFKGKWKVETDEETRIFQVNKYVLPRFHVYIIHPKNIYIGSSVVIKVCGKYSFGEIVKGTAFIRLSSIFPNIKTIQLLKKVF